MGVSLSTMYTQLFPLEPHFTGSNLPNLAGKVFIVTGATSGVGLELTKLLYAAGGAVYMFTRNETVTLKMIHAITSQEQATPGALYYIHVDLADLSTIPIAVAAFTKASPRLDILFNNAGIASAPLSYKTSQGLEPHYGTNCAAPHLLTKLILPILTATVKIAPPNSVRIIWTSSLLVDLMSPKGGVRIDQLQNPGKNRNEHYAASRVANWLLASEWDRRFCRREGIVSITQNPGNLRTNIWRTTPRLSYWPFVPLLNKGIFGAYTNLWAAFDQSITVDDGGRYVIPWGRWHPGQREDVVLALKTREEGGTGQAAGVWNWCESATTEFLPQHSLMVRETAFCTA
ncbi:putative oxidoreductase [Lachnellula suecica]|uniref:Putative oxidoreductase n=1 Tax=Lachnellula suecica TaxID=602035 RepID=A0A8T9C8L2_9HELO|nr:putative oxidoreductase [Lachnellula suecica]